MSAAGGSKTPAGVRKIAVEDLERLGIDDGNQLYWDGRRVEIHRPLVLTRPQKWLAGAATIAAVLGGLGGFVSGFNNAAIYLCARGVDVLSCPATPPAAASPKAANSPPPLRPAPASTK